MKSISIV